MIYIEISPDPGINIRPDTIERAAQETLQQQSAPDGDLTIVLADDAAIRELNRNFLGNDSPTDVLSFPANETDPESGRRYIGDVIISLPKANQKAKAAGHPVNAEVQLLVIHGVLHLLGHDHAEVEEKARMWSAQAEILGCLGLGNIQVKE